MNNVNCIVCSERIVGITENTTLYRCGDANVCSMVCSTKRFNKLKIINPRLDLPSSWELEDISLRKTDSSLFFEDTCLDIITYVNNDQKVDKTLYEVFRNIIVNIVVNIISCISN
mgnify:CR=1 FL=1